MPPMLVPLLTVAAVVAAGAVAACCTAYAKAAIVLSATRDAIGVPAALPPIAVHALSAIVAIAVMTPTAAAIAARVDASTLAPNAAAIAAPLHAAPRCSARAIADATAATLGLADAPPDPSPWSAQRTLRTHARCHAGTVLAPWVRFMERNTSTAERDRIGQRLMPHAPHAAQVAVAFVFTELNEALLLCLLLLLPFWIVDAAGGVLGAAASLPATVTERACASAKVLLLCAVGAWGALAEGLVLGYVQP